MDPKNFDPDSLAWAWATIGIQLAGDVAKLRKLLGRRLEFGTAGLRGAMGLGSCCMNDLVVLQSSQERMDGTGHVSHTAKIRWNLEPENDSFQPGHLFFRVSSCFLGGNFDWPLPLMCPSLAREYVPTWNRFLVRQLKAVAFAWVLITEQHLGVAPRVLHCKWPESSF